MDTVDFQGEAEREPMPELEDLTEAFQLLAKYDGYHLKKAWGWAVLVFGCFDLLDLSLLVLVSLELSLHASSTWAVLLPLTLLVKLLVFIGLLYKYDFFKRPLRRDGNLQSHYDVRLGLALFFMGRFPVSALFYLPMLRLLLVSDTLDTQGSSLDLFSWLFNPNAVALIFNAFRLLGALTFLIAFLLLKRVLAPREFRGLLWLGIGVLGASLVIGLGGYSSYSSDSLVFWISKEVASTLIPLGLVALGYLLCGLYALRTASNKLEGAE
ncbi:MAG: hypothetical protein ACFFBD_11655 [Candidatus Hodarchaeota archaeon]